MNLSLEDENVAVDVKMSSGEYVAEVTKFFNGENVAEVSS